MARVSEKRLREIGETAARDVMGAGRALEVEVEAGVDHAGGPAYFFDFLIDQEPDRMAAALKRSRLGRKIRDVLLRKGDEAYPYIRVLGREDWGKRRSA